MLSFQSEDSMDAKPSPSSDSRTSTPEPRTTFKDKKEAIEAFKDLLREKVSHFYVFNSILYLVALTNIQMLIF